MGRNGRADSFHLVWISNMLSPGYGCGGVIFFELFLIRIYSRDCVEAYVVVFSAYH